MSAIILETKNLTKVFGKVRAIDSVNITVYEGEVFGFLGPTGAGKTTTLGMLLGLIHPTGGEVWVFGKRITPDCTRTLKGVGAFLGAPAFVPYLSARDNLALIGRLTPGVDKNRISEVLDLVGLADFSCKHVSSFSLGMQQRMGLAIAILHQPRLLILDEPTNGLDLSGMREIRLLIRSLAENGTSVVLSSHLFNEVRQICDRIAVLEKGRVIAQGRVEDLLKMQRPVVNLEVSNVTAAYTLIQSLPGVEDVQIYGNHAVIVSGVDSHVLMNHLARNNIVPHEVTPHTSSFESLLSNAVAGDRI